MFLTGQAEVHSLCRRLRKAFPFRKGNANTGASDLTPLYAYILYVLMCFCIFIYFLNRGIR